MPYLRRRIHGRNRDNADTEQTPCPAGAIHTRSEAHGGDEFTKEALTIRVDPRISIRASGVQRPHKQAGHTSEPDHIAKAVPKTACIPRGVHTRPVELLQVGDRVITKDNGAQPIRFVARRTLQFPHAPDQLKPVLIRAGSLGDRLPYRDLTVSPQHRMLLSNRIGGEVLCLAKGLTDLAGVRIKAGCRYVEYIHLLFDRHEIIFAEGAQTESFRPGPVAIRSMEAAVQRELFEIFPELRFDATRALGDPVRPILKLREVKEMVEDQRFDFGKSQRNAAA